MSERQITPGSQPVRRRAAAEYYRQIQNLAPHGQAWPRDDENATSLLWLASAEEPARVDAAALRLLDEAHPESALDSLEDWERVLGLPDQCLPSGRSIQERRRAIVAKLTDGGHHGLAYWYGLAEGLDVEITVRRHNPFICGLSQVGDPAGEFESTPEARALQRAGAVTHRLGPPSIRYWWEVIVYGERVIRFRCGSSRLPDKLGVYRVATELECIFNRDKRAHTLVTFKYEEPRPLPG